MTPRTDPGPDDIVFDFGHDGPAVIRLEQGELEITEAVTITGDGPDLLAIDAQEQSRIFNITAETGDFTFKGMTLTRGRTTGDNQSQSNADDSFSGGAIYSGTTGMLTVQNCAVTDSAVIGDLTRGGGMFVQGELALDSSTLSGNWAHAEAAASSTMARRPSLAAPSQKTQRFTAAASLTLAR